MSQLVLAWTSPVTGDLGGALRGLLATLEELRGQDEPYWTAVAALSAAYIETAAGRYDDALRHVREALELAEHFGYSWLAAWSRVQLATLDIAQRQLHRARATLEEALQLSLAIYVTRNVTLCLVAFARLALAAGDPERAALLTGAVEGLRHRAGLGAWPMLRSGEAELVGQIHQALGTHHFNQAHDAGAQLSLRQAVRTAQSRPAAASRIGASPPCADQQ
jgi:tetratricopeptide (TPR) repeat protein